MDLNELSSLFSNNSNISPFKKSSNIKPQSDHSLHEIGDEGIWSYQVAKLAMVLNN